MGESNTNPQGFICYRELGHEFAKRLPITHAKFEEEWGKEKPPCGLGDISAIYYLRQFEEIHDLEEAMKISSQYGSIMTRRKDYDPTEKEPGVKKQYMDMMRFISGVGDASSKKSCNVKICPKTSCQYREENYPYVSEEELKRINEGEPRFKEPWETAGPWRLFE